MKILDKIKKKIKRPKEIKLPEHKRESKGTYYKIEWDYKFVDPNFKESEGK